MNLRHAWALSLTTAALDVFTTWIGMALGLVEGNPIAADVMTTLGVLPAMLLLKVCAIIFTYFAISLVPKKTQAPMVLSVSVIWGIAVVLNLRTISLLVL